MKSARKFVALSVFLTALFGTVAVAFAKSQNPNDLFMKGANLNREARFQESSKILENLQAKGMEGGGFSFEIGWAYLGTGQWEKAAQWLEKSEELRPGVGKTSEFLGRAYLGMGDYGKADRYLKEALKRDPALKPNVEFFQSVVNEARGKRPQSKTEKKPWGLQFSSSVAYNTNAIALGEGMARPNDLSQQESYIVEGMLGGFYRHNFSDKDQLNFYYRFLGDVYGTTARLNMMDHFFSMSWGHTFSEKIVGGIQVSDQHTQIRLNNFRNFHRIRPSFGWRAADWIALEGAYAWGMGHFFFPTAIAAQNRNNMAHTLSLTNYLSIPDTEWRGQLGYAFTNNRATGNDFDFNRNMAMASVSYPLVWKITASAAYARSFDRYSRVNTFATVRRSDDVSTANGRLDIELSEKVGGFLDYLYTNNDSNVRVYNYNQHVGMGGIMVNL